MPDHTPNFTSEYYLNIYTKDGNEFCEMSAVPTLEAAIVELAENIDDFNSGAAMRRDPKNLLLRIEIYTYAETVHCKADGTAERLDLLDDAGDHDARIKAAERDAMGEQARDRNAYLAWVI